MDKKFNNIEEIKSSILNNENSKFKVKIVANSKNNSIDFSEELIKIKITAQPIEGKANKAIIEFLSKILKKPKSKIKIVNGEKSSIKTIQIVN